MKRRVFLTKGSAGVFALGAIGCSKNDSKNQLVLSSLNAVISGMIADPEGNGIQDVKVFIVGPDVNKSVFTDEKGKFSIEIPEKGEYTLYPSKNGYNFNPSSQKIAIDNSNSFVVNIMAILVNISSGGITTRELGTTGIMVSNFGFGSHVENKNIGTEREYMIREAYDRGITTFDIYDNANVFMGKCLEPIKNDVVISIYYDNLDDLLRYFKRDYIDLVRIHCKFPPGDSSWEQLFKYKEQGKVRAVGFPTHDPDQENTQELLETYPIDYVIIPYNFYHNIGWPPDEIPEDFIPFAQTLREKGIGVIAMKPFAGDYFVQTLKDEANKINPDLSFNQAALRYILKSGLEPDTILTGMNYFSEFLENIEAFYHPEMSDEETALLDEVKEFTEKNAHSILPKHYRFLDKWAPKPANDSEIKFA